MRMNTIKPATGSKRAATRVGRGMGSGLGKTAGRGHKGQFARTGKGKVKPGFEGGQMPLQRRLPKIGFRSKTARDTEQVMLYQLDAVKGNDIDIAALLAANVISPRAKSAKIVLKGEIKRAVNLKGILVTAGAKAAIEAAGGKVAE
jgi:large subunit ribosomal protein L15